jgi:hypothetical protein
MGDQGWQRALSAVMEGWRTRLGVQGRVPAGWDRARRERPDATVLAEAGFQLLGSYRFPTEHEWTVDELVGFVHATSVLPRSVFADRADEFEAELRRELGSHATHGKLRETIDFAYELASKPQQRGYGKRASAASGNLLLPPRLGVALANRRLGSPARIQMSASLLRR